MEDKRYKAWVAHERALAAYREAETALAAAEAVRTQAWDAYKTSKREEENETLDARRSSER